MLNIIKEYLKLMRLHPTLKVGAYMTNVALLIKGSKIHFLIGLPFGKSINPHIIKPSLIDWINIHHLTIYEILMIGWNMLIDLHFKLEILKTIFCHSKV
jgi:hypothetical protein